ncbi:unnamed protein product, partial [Discosporangium mesarthrocarpum]
RLAPGSPSHVTVSTITTSPALPTGVLPGRGGAGERRAGAQPSTTASEDPVSVATDTNGGTSMIVSAAAAAPFHDSSRMGDMLPLRTPAPVTVRAMGSGTLPFSRHAPDSCSPSSSTQSLFTAESTPEAPGPYMVAPELFSAALGSSHVRTPASAAAPTSPPRPKAQRAKLDHRGQVSIHFTSRVKVKGAEAAVLSLAGEGEEGASPAAALPALPPALDVWDHEWKGCPRAVTVTATAAATTSTAVATPGKLTPATRGGRHDGGASPSPNTSCPVPQPGPLYRREFKGVGDGAEVGAAGGGAGGAGHSHKRQEEGRSIGGGLISGRACLSPAPAPALDTGPRFSSPELAVDINSSVTAGSAGSYTSPEGIRSSGGGEKEEQACNGRGRGW